MDSDKRNVRSQLKDRVKRIKEELPHTHWVTKGKEIENYLPSAVLTSYFEKMFKLNSLIYFLIFIKVTNMLNLLIRSSLLQKLFRIPIIQKKA